VESRQLVNHRESFYNDGMLNRITGQVAHCLAEASRCSEAAAVANMPEIQANYRQLAASWMALAESMQLAERVSGFLQWNAQRLRS